MHMYTMHTLILAYTDSYIHTCLPVYGHRFKVKQCLCIILSVIMHACVNRGIARKTFGRGLDLRGFSIDFGFFMHI